MHQTSTPNRSILIRHSVGRISAWFALVAIAFLLASLPLREAALLAGAITGAIVLLRWPWLIWLPLAILLPFSSSIRFGVASATDFLFALAILLWFLDGARRRTLPLQQSPVIAATTVYLLVLTLSALGALDLGEAAAEVVKWFELLVLLLVAPSMLTASRARWVASALVLGGALQAALGLYQFVFRIGPDYFIILGQFMRASGTFGQPNPFGGYLGLTLPAALSFAIWAWAQFLGGTDRRWSSALWGFYFSAATILIAAGLLASWSRGAWLGALIGVVIVVVLRSRTAAILSAIAALIIAASLLVGSLQPESVPQPIAERLQDLPAYFGLTDVLDEPVTDENFSVVERVAHWVAAQRMWEQAPWLGVGPGNYAVVYPEVRLPKWEEALGHAHNVYLNVLGETGLYGLFAYLVLVATTLLWTWRRFRQATRLSTPNGRWFAALAVGVLGILGHLTVHNLVDNLFVQGMVLHIGLWLALVHVDFDGVKR